MNKISCDVCLDLIPLVQDNVASDDSKELVSQHITECEICKSELNKIKELPTMDDKRVISKIKYGIYLFILISICIGTVIGVSLAGSDAMFYNIIIMPLIGGIGYFILNKKWWIIPAGVFTFTFIDQFIINMTENMYYIIFASAVWALIYTALCVFGVVTAFLLKFAFKKEDNNEKNI